MKNKHLWVLYRRVGRVPEVAQEHGDEFFICSLSEWSKRKAVFMGDNFIREFLTQSTDRKALVKMKELTQGG